MNEPTNARKRILIAEDDPVSRRLLELFLVKWGFEVAVATTGTEALAMLERMDAPRLAILDWMMPGMEGVQVCQKLRESSDRPYVYVMLLTARTQKEDLLQGLESGADDYLTKPFDSQELRARLHVGQRILDLQDQLIAAGEELLYRATHDNLTGMVNRGVIMDTLRRERARQAREGGSFGIVLVDLDHFKYVNDTHGHLAGDDVLREAAQRMMGCVRPYDSVGRYGGEEFLIVVPSSDAMGTMGLAERMRRAIEAKPMVTNSVSIAVTASFGVTASIDKSPLDAQEILRLADAALYRAKERGRNRVELARPEDLIVRVTDSPEALEQKTARR
ncbi:MAG: diguanylate cyclase [Candidatus Acidiferrales bacterium]|jgi:two-component system cell cycle response regulator